jgi:hypothetical protein
MGASTFEAIGHGKTADEAFAEAVRCAQYEHGRGGYSGTAAEKRSYVLITTTPLSIEQARAQGDRLIEEGDGRIEDKWGPAGCIPLADRRYYFFGWASS